MVIRPASNRFNPVIAPHLMGYAWSSFAASLDNPDTSMLEPKRMACGAPQLPLERCRKNRFIFSLIAGWQLAWLPLAWMMTQSFWQGT
jgi:hypothetical protein